MTKQFQYGLGRRIANTLTRWAVERGRGPEHVHILSVRGRKTGQVHSNPVDIMEVGGHRYLVAPYGVRDWVRNARAAGEITLSRGGRSEAFRTTEVGPDEAAPVLRKYLQEVRIVRPFFDVSVDSSDEQIAAEAHRHPVFRLEPASA